MIKAITIRQPWAWLVVRGFKDIENRTWATSHRGRVLIHAGRRKVKLYEYEAFRGLCREIGIISYPEPHEFKTGGIIGSVEIVDCVTKSQSAWFRGPIGFRLENAQEHSFKPMLGRPKIWDIRS